MVYRFAAAAAAAYGVALAAVAGGTGAVHQIHFKQQQVFLLIDPLVVDPVSHKDGWETKVIQPVKEVKNPLLQEDKMWDVRWDSAHQLV